jgi:hypothetical protein
MDNYVWKWLSLESTVLLWAFQLQFYIYMDYVKTFIVASLVATVALLFAMLCLADRVTAWLRAMSTRRRPCSDRFAL